MFACVCPCYAYCLISYLKKILTWSRKIGSPESANFTSNSSTPPMRDWARHAPVSAFHRFWPGFYRQWQFYWVLGRYCAENATERRFRRKMSHSAPLMKLHTLTLDTRKQLFHEFHAHFVHMLFYFYLNKWYFLLNTGSDPLWHWIVIITVKSGYQISGPTDSLQEYWSSVQAQK